MDIRHTTLLPQIPTFLDLWGEFVYPLFADLFGGQLLITCWLDNGSMLDKHLFFVSVSVAFVVRCGAARGPYELKHHGFILEYP